MSLTSQASLALVIPRGRAMTGSQTKGVGPGSQTANRGRRRAALAAAGVAAAAAKLGHVLGFLAVFRTVLAKFTVGWDRAGTTRMSARLRLIHNAPLLAAFVRTIVAQHGAGRSADWGQSEGGPGARESGLLGGGWRTARIHFALGSEDAAPVLVLRDGHAAFDADSDALPGLGIAGKQLFQK